MKKRVWIAVVILLIINLAAGGFVWYTISKTHSSITVEAGSVVTAEHFIKREVEEIFFAEDCPAFDTTVPGTYELRITADGFTRSCLLHVEDTVAPKAEPVAVYMSVGETYEAEAFVKDVQDVTPVTARFEERPDFGGYGLQDVNIILTDTSGNETTVKSELYVLKVKVNETYVWDTSKGTPKAEWFLVKPGEISYTGVGLQYVHFDEIGVYPVWLKADGFVCKVNMEITDTKAPIFTVKETEGYIGHPVEAAEFIETVEEDTQVKFYYGAEPDWSLEGQQEVVIVAEDAAGNKAEMPGVLTLIPDTEAPVIIGTGNISICIGENVSYRNGISAYDNCDGEVPVQIDNSAVDLNTLGTYHVFYTATDAAGNVTTHDIKLTVMPERNEEVSLEAMYALADQVLAEIITEDMTDYQKAEAIYNWTRWKISFISDSQKENWVESAYDGFVYRKGDCYTYASVAKALLTRAGIPNIDVWRNSTTSSHYWNLVDTGQGWYHFDATPRADKTIIFMWSETQLIENEAVRRSHVYDRTLFPAVSTEPIKP
ncbi:MAG: transglutaminase domain-containing protein [Lachnospiraceae bacterium]|nr:transglutaminase domain-containing protein [Lachnospiraceae bacterium]